MNQIENKPLVSVLMTTYNREKYIGEAIESVLSSTYQNFELIIVDDCSEDNTVVIAKSFAEKDNRMSVYINEYNLGDYPNRNKAASYATGKYIKYVDADDYIYSNGLEIIVNQMEKFQEAAVGLFSLPQNKEKPFPILLNPNQAYEYNFFGLGLFHKAPLSAIFRKDAFEEVGGFMPDRMTSDFEMWHRMAQTFNFLLIQDQIVWYREHDAQEVNSKSKFELTYCRIERNYIWHEKSPLTEIQRRSVIRKRVKSFIIQIIIGILKLRMNQVRLNIRKISLFLLKSY
jgi:glycosyltransferase involved in cell wall biosynthesis